MNKALIGITTIILMILLSFTKSLYVEWNELIIVIISITIGSLSYHYSTHKLESSHLLGISAVSGFFFCVLLGIIDITIDHFLYFLPSGNEDGDPLSLRFKIEEYNDDLFIESLISFLCVPILSFIASKTISFFTKNN
ncbi:hypothetical protein ACFSCX_13065 [Bacillus salitolerans]|uniref:Uncharacterized protein n=1 Tax=Bacillus salitolerans TaxID=1437434 RepID=A0ABW4LTN5_9BACI